MTDERRNKMLDLRLIREHPDEVKAALARRHMAVPIDAILATDQTRRDLLGELENLRNVRNVTSKEIGRLKDTATRQAKIKEMRAVNERIGTLEERLRQVEADLNRLMLDVPNLPAPTVPDGHDEKDNVLVRQWGELPRFDFEPLPHWDLGPALGIINFDQGVKLSGSRFYVLHGAGARLERALIQWMLDLHVRQGYREVYTPFIVKAETLIGAGQLPKFEDNLYHDVEDDVWLVPTAEVPVTNLHRDEILEPGMLPLYYVAYTPCFRREKMSAGRDVRGIKRGHQFDKVEMYKFVTPETSDAELETLVADAEETCRLLGIPYRVIQLCTADLGFASRITYDVEMWAPGCGEWLEVSSCSNVTDFQARRANIRYRPAAGAKTEFVHTLNGSGLGLPRTLIAVLENYQQADGSVVVPDVLRPYMGGLERITGA